MQQILDRDCSQLVKRNETEITWTELKLITLKLHQWKKHIQKLEYIIHLGQTSLFSQSTDFTDPVSREIKIKSTGLFKKIQHI